MADATSDGQTHAVLERYARFARDEAPGRSALYAEWADGVAAHPELAAIIARIPAARRQPPLVFAVTRMLGAPEDAFPAWAAWLRAHADEVVAAASVRRLQTNEPQRCAALLPALATIDGPIALLELGASAGLCLYPDRYSYRYRGSGGVVALDPEDGTSTVVLDCEVTGDPPLRLPRVLWRAGIDLEPLDAADTADRGRARAGAPTGSRRPSTSRRRTLRRCSPATRPTRRCCAPPRRKRRPARRSSSRRPGCSHTSRGRAANASSTRCAPSTRCG